MKNNDIELNDIFEWDVVNWSKSINYFDSYLSTTNNICIELGANKGGLSLWLASKGNNVICSDLYSPALNASKIHNKYECSNKISYEAIDATNIPYKDYYFDIVVFKSILGGISLNNDELLKKTIEEIYKVLKPGGKLFFSENLKATYFHMFSRNYFLKRKVAWNYLDIKKIDSLFSSFKQINYFTTGFLGTFGRTENQRKILGKIDRMIEPLIPKSWRYIVIGVAEK